MLPFLRPRAQTGVIVEQRKPDEETPSEISELEMAADDLINAIHAKDKRGVAEALKACYALCASEPESDPFEGEGDTE